MADKLLSQTRIYYQKIEVKEIKSLKDITIAQTACENGKIPQFKKRAIAPSPEQQDRLKLKVKERIKIEHNKIYDFLSDQSFLTAQYHSDVISEIVYRLFIEFPEVRITYDKNMSHELLKKIYANRKTFIYDSDDYAKFFKISNASIDKFKNKFPLDDFYVGYDNFFAVKDTLSLRLNQDDTYTLSTRHIANFIKNFITYFGFLRAYIEKKKDNNKAVLAYYGMLHINQSLFFVKEESDENNIEAICGIGFDESYHIQGFMNMLDKYRQNYVEAYKFDESVYDYDGFCSLFTNYVELLFDSDFQPIFQKRGKKILPDGQLKVDKLDRNIIHSFQNNLDLVEKIFKCSSDNTALLDNEAIENKDNVYTKFMKEIMQNPNKKLHLLIIPFGNILKYLQVDQKMLISQCNQKSFDILRSKVIECIQATFFSMLVKYEPFFMGGYAFYERMKCQQKVNIGHYFMMDRPGDSVMKDMTQFVFAQFTETDVGSTKSIKQGPDQKCAENLRVQILDEESSKIIEKFRQLNKDFGIVNKNYDETIRKIMGVSNPLYEKMVDTKIQSNTIYNPNFDLIEPSQKTIGAPSQKSLVIRKSDAFKAHIANNNSKIDSDYKRQSDGSILTSPRQKSEKILPEHKSGSPGRKDRDRDQLQRSMSMKSIKKSYNDLPDNDSNYKKSPTGKSGSPVVPQKLTQSLKKIERDHRGSQQRKSVSDFKRANDRSPDNSQTKSLQQEIKQIGKPDNDNDNESRKSLNRKASFASNLYKIDEVMESSSIKDHKSTRSVKNSKLKNGFSKYQSAMDQNTGRFENLSQSMRSMGGFEASKSPSLRSIKELQQSSKSVKSKRDPYTSSKSIKELQKSTRSIRSKAPTHLSVKEPDEIEGKLSRAEMFRNSIRAESSRRQSTISKKNIYDVFTSQKFEDNEDSEDYEYDASEEYGFEGYEKVGVTVFENDVKKLTEKEEDIILEIEGNLQNEAKPKKADTMNNYMNARFGQNQHNKDLFVGNGFASFFNKIKDQPDLVENDERMVYKEQKRQDKNEQIHEKQVDQLLDDIKIGMKSQARNREVNEKTNEIKYFDEGYGVSGPEHVKEEKEINFDSQDELEEEYNINHDDCSVGFEASPKQKPATKPSTTDKNNLPDYKFAKVVNQSLGINFDNSVSPRKNLNLYNYPSESNKLENKYPLLSTDPNQSNYYDPHKNYYDPSDNDDNRSIGSPLKRSLGSPSKKRPTSPSKKTGGLNISRNPADSIYFDLAEDHDEKENIKQGSPLLKSVKFKMDEIGGPTDKFEIFEEFCANHFDIRKISIACRKPTQLACNTSGGSKFAENDRKLQRELSKQQYNSQILDYEGLSELLAKFRINSSLIYLKYLPAIFRANKLNKKFNETLMDKETLKLDSQIDKDLYVRMQDLLFEEFDVKVGCFEDSLNILQEIIFELFSQNYLIVYTLLIKQSIQQNQTRLLKICVDDVYKTDFTNQSYLLARIIEDHIEFLFDFFFQDLLVLFSEHFTKSDDFFQPYFKKMIYNKHKAILCINALRFFFKNNELGETFALNLSRPMLYHWVYEVNSVGVDKDNRHVTKHKLHKKTKTGGNNRIILGTNSLVKFIKSFDISSLCKEIYLESHQNKTKQELIEIRVIRALLEYIMTKQDVYLKARAWNDYNKIIFLVFIFVYIIIIPNIVEPYTQIYNSDELTMKFLFQDQALLNTTYSKFRYISKPGTYAAYYEFLEILPSIQPSLVFYTVKDSPTIITSNFSEMLDYVELISPVTRQKLLATNKKMKRVCVNQNLGFGDRDIEDLYGFSIVLVLDRISGISLPHRENITLIGIDDFEFLMQTLLAYNEGYETLTIFSDNTGVLDLDNLDPKNFDKNRKTVILYGNTSLYFMKILSLLELYRVKLENKLKLFRSNYLKQQKSIVQLVSSNQKSICEGDNEETLLKKFEDNWCLSNSTLTTYNKFKYAKIHKEKDVLEDVCLEILKSLQKYSKHHKKTSLKQLNATSHKKTQFFNKDRIQCDSILSDRRVRKSMIKLMPLLSENLNIFQYYLHLDAQEFSQIVKSEQNLKFERNLDILVDNQTEISAFFRFCKDIVNIGEDINNQKNLYKKHKEFLEDVYLKDKFYLSF